MLIAQDLLFLGKAVPESGHDGGGKAVTQGADGDLEVGEGGFHIERSNIGLDHALFQNELGNDSGAETETDEGENGFVTGDGAIDAWAEIFAVEPLLKVGADKPGFREDHGDVGPLDAWGVEKGGDGARKRGADEKEGGGGDEVGFDLGGNFFGEGRDGDIRAAVENFVDRHGGVSGEEFDVDFGILVPEGVEESGKDAVAGGHRAIDGEFSL